MSNQASLNELSRASSSRSHLRDYSDPKHYRSDFPYRRPEQRSSSSPSGKTQELPYPRLARSASAASGIVRRGNDDYYGSSSDSETLIPRAIYQSGTAIDVLTPTPSPSWTSRSISPSATSVVSDEMQDNFSRKLSMRQPQYFSGSTLPAPPIKEGDIVEVRRFERGSLTWTKWQLGRVVPVPQGHMMVPASAQSEPCYFVRPVRRGKEVTTNQHGIFEESEAISRHIQSLGEVRQVSGLDWKFDEAAVVRHFLRLENVKDVYASVAISLVGQAPAASPPPAVPVWNPGEIVGWTDSHLRVRLVAGPFKGQTRTVMAALRYHPSTVKVCLQRGDRVMKPDGTIVSLQKRGAPTS
ncbi:hypothetical protein NLJ89_g9441 [Agrocybe chaxingu]|uniref:Uncharacterized protein n=1 Tax=Agrocybe chaxingu TaxID=84603 RepID=A0A9W8MTJ3_9AGAR|nr:hypothetical protein NLJ89_g9441 [Agrocybe chaxingu]